ncbi:MAG: hypothetical protein ACLQPN_16835, partial [Bryobacteraceae bacterium]
MKTSGETSEERHEDGPGTNRATTQLSPPSSNDRCGAVFPQPLLPEDYDTDAQRMWGNFPQTYSHVGLIHAAFAASPRWMEVL